MQSDGGVAKSRMRASGVDLSACALGDATHLNAALSAPSLLPSFALAKALETVHHTLGDCCAMSSFS